MRGDSGSLLRHGDLSVLSFHATKVFTTLEGGAIVCPDAKTKQRIDHLKNFGFVNEITVVAPGINGKMSEVNAALGLLQLKYIDRAILRRKEIDAEYRKHLAAVPGIHCLPAPDNFSSNFAYFPILIGSEYGCGRDDLYQRLKRANVHTRRYFYPLISEFPMYRGLTSADKTNLPIATRIAAQVLCLPMSSELQMEELRRVIDVIGDCRIAL